MGGDGGVIAAQRRFIRGTKEPGAKSNIDSQYNKDNQQSRARTCAISNEPLREPIVACEMGNLYNKEEVVKSLLEKNLPPQFAHIRGLKDVQTLKFTRSTNCTNSSISSLSVPSSSSSGDGYPYICPVTFVEFNGLTNFYFIWKHSLNKTENVNCSVISEKGLKQLVPGYY